MTDRVPPDLRERQRALDHRLGAAADQGAGDVVWHLRQPLLPKRDVERVDEVGRRIDQRAVEIEDDGEHDVAYRPPMGRARANRMRSAALPLGATP